MNFSPFSISLDALGSRQKAPPSPSFMLELELLICGDLELGRRGELQEEGHAARAYCLLGTESSSGTQILSSDCSISVDLLLDHGQVNFSSLCLSFLPWEMAAELADSPCCSASFLRPRGCTCSACDDVDTRQRHSNLSKVMQAVSIRATASVGEFGGLV